MYTHPIQATHQDDPEHEMGHPGDISRDEEAAAHSSRAGKAVASSADEDDIEEEGRNQDGANNALATRSQQHDDEQTYGFYHPAASRPQRTVWIPQDEFGVSRAELKGCTEMGVRASSANGYAEIVDRRKAKVKVDVKGGPPDLIGVVI